MQDQNYLEFGAPKNYTTLLRNRAQHNIKRIKSNAKKYIALLFYTLFRLFYTFIVYELFLNDLFLYDYSFSNFYLNNSTNQGFCIFLYKLFSARDFFFDTLSFIDPYPPSELIIKDTIPSSIVRTVHAEDHCSL